MNKIRYVQERRPPPVATSADLQRVLEAISMRSWAGITKAQIVKKEAPSFKSKRSREEFR
jgi:hypothetical protein